MKRYLALALVLCFLFTLAPFRTALAQDQYEEQVLQQLEAASMVFTSAGYTPIVADGGKLSHRASQTYTVSLETGQTYQLIGVCDEDCLDLDLELFDGYGDLVSQDASNDAAPVVEVTVAQGGDFTLKVTMYDCDVQVPCYYGVGLYGEALDQYEQQVLQQLEAVSDVFTSAGYTPVVADGGSLAHQASQTYTVSLETGYTYQLVGVCDEDCPDLDLELFDGYGDLVSQDASNDAAPIVEVTVAQGGDFTLKVTMYQCNASVCYYGVGLYQSH